MNNAKKLATELYQFLYFHTTNVDGDAFAPSFGIEEIIRKYFSESEIWEIKNSIYAEDLLRTSAEWIRNYDVVLLDPDGWDRSNYDFSFNQEEITRLEFEKRLTSSTIQPTRQYDKDYPNFRKKPDTDSANQ